MSFITETRQNMRNLTTLPHTANNTVQADISRVGFLSTITLRFAGKLTAKHASKTTFTKAAEAPYNIADRVRFVLNNGVSVWDTSGYGAYLQNIICDYHYRMDEFFGSNKAYQCVYSFGNKVSAAGTANDVNFTIKMPISLNDRDMIGLLLLQSSQIVGTVQVVCANANVLMEDTDVQATLEGTWHISYEYFDVPLNTADYPVTDVVHQVLEDQNPISAAGENRFVIPRGNTYLRIINQIKLNNKPTLDGIEKASLRYNLTNEPYSLKKEDLLTLQLERYGRPLPDGVLVWDFFYQGIPNLGNNRDFVDTHNVSEFDQFVNIDSSADLGNNNNVMRVIRDTLLDVTPVQ